MVKFEFGGEIGCGRINVVKFEFGVVENSVVKFDVVKLVVVEFGCGSAGGGSCLLAE